MMRDYRHSLFGQSRGIPEMIKADRSTPVAVQLWRESETGQMVEIVAVGKHAINGEPLVAYRKYEPNGEVLFLTLVDFLDGQPDNYRFTREF